MMEKKIKIVDQYDWDLETLLQGKTLDDFFCIWEKKIDEVVKLYDEGKCFGSISQFSKYMEESDELELLSNRIVNYVSNKHNEDLGNNVIIGWKQRVMYKYNYLQVELSNFTNDVISNRDNIEQYLKKDKLKKYQRFFDLIFRTKKHTLKKNESKFMAAFSPMFSSPADIYKTLSGADLKFSTVVDCKNKIRKINTIADVSKYLKDSDRVLRKNTFIAFAQAYKNFENSFSQTLYYHYLISNTCAKAHRFNDYISQTAFEDEIDVSFIQFVYQQVAEYSKYYQLFRAEVEKNYRHVLNLRKVEPWDLSYPLFSVNHNFTIGETMKLVKSALRPLGEEYLLNIQRAFDEKWISWLPKPAKVTGAYSIGGTRGLDKFYILMNFDGTLNSVYTIAHELGHSMHSLAFNHQPVHAESEIFFAEISSITNEILLSDYLLKEYEGNLEKTLHILQEMIFNFFATTTRQIVFSDFEFTVNDLINKKQPINPQVIKNIYAQKIVQYYGYNEKYFNKLLTDNNLFLNLSHIFRISHFYERVFYVYKYAIGQVAAMINAQNIIQQKESALNCFQRFLASGNSLSPIDTVSLLGINLQSSEPWQRAGQIIKNYIELFVKLSREYRKK